MDEKTVARFWSKVDIGASEQCWLWKGQRDRDGYGRFRLPKRYARAHRVSYEIVHGSIPTGLFVCHNCPGGDDPSCVNPRHLWLGTNSANLLDASAKGTICRGDRHWQRVHPERKARGQTRHTAKLTDAEVMAIRNAYADGALQTELGIKYGVSQKTVSSIIRRETWTHLP